MLRPYKGTWPTLGERVYVDASAQVIGDVVLGDHASVWMNAVLRGDVNSIRVGPGTNIQDNCVVHVYKATHPMVLADHVTVGHSVTLHGCTIGSWCLIGMGATILNGAVIGDESIVAAGTLVPEGMKVPAGSLVMGLPAKIRRPVTAEEREGLRVYANNYLEYKETYLEETAMPLPGPTPRV
jgi:carbonic anhydrase/acetyltransferase-like protein (isoleucine patch superfamily)